MKIKENDAFYRIFMVFNAIVMVLLVVIMIFPYVHVIAKAFNEGLDTMRGGISIWPRKFTFENIWLVIGDESTAKAITVSVIRVLTGVACGIFVQFSAAYALTKKTMPGRNGFLIYFTIPMFFSGGMVPTYMLFSQIGLLNNFWVYILPVLFNFYNIIIIRTFINTTIPDCIEESAIIDGASELVVFVRIILPLCKPILATIALWLAVLHWNDWMATLLYVNSNRLHTLQYKMMEIIKESERVQKMIEQAIVTGQDVSEIQVKATSDALASAQILVTTLPIIIVYPFLQKYFVKGVMLGSVKG